MSITTDDIKKIAQLGRIAIEETTYPLLCNDLNHILMLAEKMNTLPVSDIEPLSHPLDAVQPCISLRDDQVTECNERESFQKIAPLVQVGCYIVPNVLENE